MLLGSGFSSESISQAFVHISFKSPLNSTYFRCLVKPFKIFSMFSISGFSFLTILVRHCFGKSGKCGKPSGAASPLLLSLLSLFHCHHRHCHHHYHLFYLEDFYGKEEVFTFKFNVFNRQPFFQYFFYGISCLFSNCYLK